MNFRGNLKLTAILIACLASSCALLDDSAPKKSPPASLIATPVSYYSTPKARYLGTKYKENLERLAARIGRDPKTAPLQFANNISSVGGIGFFTHSAAKTPDERYLEVVLATPETFEAKGDYSEKVSQLFSRYGLELLGILGGDKEMYQDKELSGYGLNLAWRDVTGEGPTSRVAMSRAIIYLQKDRVLDFLRDKLNANKLLANAVIFAVEDDGPLQLVSYQPHQTKPDYRPAIQEDNLAEPMVGSKAPQTASSSAAGKQINQRAGQKAESAKPQPAEVKENSQSARTNMPTTAESKAAATLAPVAPNDRKTLERPPESVAKPVQTPLAGKDDAGAERLALGRETDSIAPSRQAKTPAAISKDAPAAERKSDNKTKPEVPAPMIESKTPATSSQISQSEEEDKTRLAHAAIAEAKSESNGMKNQTAATAAVETSPKASPDTAPSTIGHEAKSNQGAELKPRETVIASTSNVKSAVSPDVTEKVIVAAPAAAKPESRGVTAKQPAAAKLPAPLPASRVENAPPAADAATPESKPVPQESKSGSPANAKTTAAVTVPEASKATKAKETATGAVYPSTARLPEPESAAESAKTGRPVDVARNEAVATKPVASPVAPAVREKIVEKAAPEQLASLKKPSENLAEKKPLTRATPKPLEGFIIQIAFNDKEKAQSWAEKMEQRGYAVSVTEAGGAGSLRVRLGNFAVRDEAERQLKNLKQDGMTGIIINLPQAFRPEARSSVP